MQIVYHGTDEATAKKILKKGFKPGTFFALHLEDSVGFGGNYIFEVAVESASLPKPSKKLGTDWEFIATDRVPPSQIVQLKHYPKAKSITENKALSEAVFRSNLPEPKPQPDVRVVSSGPIVHTSRLNIQPHRSLTREPRGKVVKGVAYADKGKKRLSRRHHRGFHKVKFA
jgi:hypothetical protein